MTSVNDDEITKSAERFGDLLDDESMKFAGILAAKSATVRPPFGKRLHRAAEEGALLFVKWALFLGLWLGSGWIFWVNVATLRQNAQQGAQAFGYLTTGDKYRAIDAMVKPQQAVVQPSPAMPTSDDKPAVGRGR